MTQVVRGIGQTYTVATVIDRVQELGQLSLGFLPERTVPTGIMMCRPENYDVEYDINFHMTGNGDEVKRILAQQQWKCLRRTLEQFCTVSSCVDAPGLPDMAFIANAGLTFSSHGRKQCIMSRMKHPQRSGEIPLYEAFVRGRGYEIFHLPDNVVFEGEGDALWLPEAKLLWGGYGQRSERAAYEHISRMYDVPVIALELIDKRFYHLDTAFCPLDPYTAMYFPGAFAPAGQHLIEAIFPNRILLKDSEAMLFGCNAIVIGKRVIMPLVGRRLRYALHDSGYRVHAANMSEFIKAGGAAKCLVLEDYK